MSSSPRRFLIVPDAEFQAASVVRVVDADTGTLREEAGRRIGQPTVDTAHAPAGDIRLTLSGEPEEHVAGTIKVARSGPIDKMRIGWVREGDDELADLQLRQSAMCFGRRPDVLARTTGATDAVRRWLVKPKILPLISGGAMLLYLAQIDHPSRAASGLATDGHLMMAVLNPATDTWSNPTEIVLSFGSANQIVAVDAVQLPDTGEIVMLVAAQNGWGAAATDRRVYVFHSVDDGGTWYERARLFCEGDEPDLDLAGDAAQLNAVAVELLDSGRIVALLATDAHILPMTSDDRGHAWSVAASVATGRDAVALARMRNGALLGLATTYGSASMSALITLDGVTWTVVGANDGSNDIREAGCPAIVMRPDGWPQAYVTVHSWGGAGLGVAWRDWICARTLGVRDPDLASTRGDLMPADGSAATFGRWLGCHLVETPSRVGYPDAGEFGGFLGIDAINYRGQILIAATVARESGTYESETTPPELAESAVVVYRTAQWQPLQECLAHSKDRPIGPEWGRVYNRGWEPYGEPDNWGFARSAGGGFFVSMVAGGGEGGYLKTSVATGSLSYADTSIPAPHALREGVLRAVLLPKSGGSSGTEAIAIRLRLDDGASGVGISIRFAIDVAAIKVYAYDANSGALIGERDLPIGHWIEIRASIYGAGGSSRATVFARDYNRAADRDWDAPYVLVGDDFLTVQSVGLTDTLAFGHFGSGETAECWWKSIALSRSDEAMEQTPLNQRGLNWVDNDSDTVLATSGRPFDQNDGGVDNVMRAGQATAHPAQWICRGVYVSARGEAITQGRFEHAAAYDYAASNILSLPVRREWRSVGADREIEIVLDAGAGRSFRPDAVAFFGRNFPSCRIELNASNAWSAPTVTRSFGVPDDGTSPQRYTHIWAYVGTGWSYYCSGRRLTVFPPGGGSGPWRPHQFRSQATGPRYYVAFNASPTYVYRVEDNTADTITFASPLALSEIGIPGESGTSFLYPWSVFSDRFASLFEHRFPATVTSGGLVRPNSHARGYRYCRIVVMDCTHKDPDEAFGRLGYVLFGKAIDIAAPDFSWGSSRHDESGVDLQDMGDGSSVAMRRHSPRRVLTVDHAYLRPPDEADAVTRSPADARPEGKASWAHWLDLVRRLEVGRTPVALIWQGDRAVGQGDEALVQVAADPQDLMLARVTDPGEIEQTVWECREIDAPGGAEMVPFPSCAIRRITFREEL